ncbi:MAG: hypothetical protein ACRDI2_10170 [Chloroflexota bacterium]
MNVDTDHRAQRRAAALTQPNAKERSNGAVKFACPACVTEGYDYQRDNAVYFPDTDKWSCAWAHDTEHGRRHWDAIGRALGVFDRCNGHAAGQVDTPGGSLTPPAEAEPLRVPDEGLVGLGREFAELYAEYLESPRSFFYFGFLTYVGAAIAGKITLDSELRPEPRLYTVLLGESADTRKSTALRKVDEFFRSLGTGYAPATLFGVGSAEGIAAELKEHAELLLHFDELKTFVDKARSEHSIALPMVSTLFERGEYDNRTKDTRVSIRGASLNLLAACTRETYASIFDQKFLAIGFPNRLWLVSDRSDCRIPVPRPIPETRLERLRTAVRQRLDAVDQAYRANGLRPAPYRLTPGALAAFQGWYEARTGSVFERRLDTYGHRLMLLLAVSAGRDVIDEDLVERVVTLLRYQLELRRECDPIDADNTIAALEERIRRTLARGAMRGRDLKRRCSYHRAGLWAWEQAVTNLRKAGEIVHEAKADLVWLTTDGRESGQGVSTFVSTPVLTPPRRVTP